MNFENVKTLIQRIVTDLRYHAGAATHQESEEIKEMYFAFFEITSCLYFALEQKETEKRFSPSILYALQFTKQKLDAVKQTPIFKKFERRCVEDNLRVRIYQGMQEVEKCLEALNSNDLKKEKG